MIELCKRARAHAHGSQQLFFEPKHELSEVYLIQKSAFQASGQKPGRARVSSPDLILFCADCDVPLLTAQPWANYDSP
ncbi:MAG TPA: hypothetical protein VF553_12265 [Pyrinomonadaceae bacterium]